MPELNFAIEGAQAVDHAVLPLLNFKLRLSEKVAAGGAASAIHSVALRCQIRIEPTRRVYRDPEPRRLQDLFGDVPRWGQTLRAMLWNHVSVIVPPFCAAATVDLPVPCSYDFNVAANKYFAALESGEVPLSFLFSGTIFHADADGFLQVAQISWEKEASYGLPVKVWRDMMEMYYPNGAWLCVKRDVLEALSHYKTSGAFLTWDAALESLLAGQLQGSQERSET